MHHSDPSAMCPSSSSKCSPMRIRVFRPDESAAYREVRLRALQDAPDAFATTFEEASRWPPSQWERLRAVPLDSNLPLCAEMDGAIVAMMWARLDERARETVHLYQVWVAPQYRGRGLARAMLEKVIDWAGAVGARRIDLGVTCGDSPARRLYEAFGFRPIGESTPLRKESALRVQTMELRLVDCAE